MLYLWISMVKYDIDSEIMRNYEKLWEIMRNYEKLWEIMRNYEKLWEIVNSSISVFDPFANICKFGHIKKYSVHYLDLTCLINNEWVFGLSLIFGIFGLTLKFQNWQ